MQTAMQRAECVSRWLRINRNELYMGKVNMFFGGEDGDEAWKELRREFLNEITPQEVTNIEHKELFSAAFEARSHNETVKSW